MIGNAVWIVFYESFFNKFIDSFLGFFVKSNDEVLSFTVGFLLNSDLLELFNKLALWVYILVIFKFSDIKIFRCSFFKGSTISNIVFKFLSNLYFPNNTLSRRLQVVILFEIVIFYKLIVKIVTYIVKKDKLRECFRIIMSISSMIKMLIGWNLCGWLFHAGIVRFYNK